MRTLFTQWKLSKFLEYENFDLNLNFCQNSLRLLAVNWFHRKAQLYIFESILNGPLVFKLINILCPIGWLICVFHQSWGYLVVSSLFIQSCLVFCNKRISKNALHDKNYITECRNWSDDSLVNTCIYRFWFNIL